MTKVSVIIPAYNSEKTIKKCIDSALGQTLRDIEIIAVNDGSVDKTADILSEYGDKIKVLTIKNSRQGIARNKGLEAAEGEYIGFLDADDTIEPEMYEIMYKKAHEFSADAVQCAVRDIKNNTSSVRSGIDADVEIKNTDEYISEYFYKLIHTNEVCNKLFKRSFLEDNKLRFFDTAEVYSEDLAFNIETLKYLKRISFISRPLYNYYITDGGHCKKNPAERINKIWRLYKRANENIKKAYDQKAIMSMAVINILTYSADITDMKQTRQIIASGEFKKYCIASARYKKTIKHTLLMLSIIALPYALKKKIINKYYRF